MSKSKKLPTPRSPGGKALESGEFRHRVIPTRAEKYSDKYKNHCEDCGQRYEDCDCDGEYDDY